MTKTWLKIKTYFLNILKIKIKRKIGLKFLVYNNKTSHFIELNEWSKNDKEDEWTTLESQTR